MLELLSTGSVALDRTGASPGWPSLDDRFSPSLVSLELDCSGSGIASEDDDSSGAMLWLDGTVPDSGVSGFVVLSLPQLAQKKVAADKKTLFKLLRIFIFVLLS